MYAAFNCCPRDFFGLDAQNGSTNGFECHGAQLGIDGRRTYCPNPTTGILFDGIVPTLVGLDGDTWARKLLTIHLVPTTPDSHVSVTYDFTNTSSGYAALGRVEVVFFNCPQWQISVQTIRFFDAVNGVELDTFHLPSYIASCNSLVRVCRALRASQSVLRMQFYPHPGSQWVHLAEVTFHGTYYSLPNMEYVGTECPPVPAPPMTVTPRMGTPKTVTPTSGNENVHMRDNYKHYPWLQALRGMCVCGCVFVCGGKVDDWTMHYKLRHNLIGH